ncbi:MAG: thioredoxin family protein [Phycisphaerales bacterium]|jgi:thiol-disulfide isomerase/thioredoxin|nr:thioredoxin family protein [Planctomycetota bacterium]
MTTTPILDANSLHETFEAALSWEDYLATDEDRANRWREFHERVGLDEDQRTLIGGFGRRMPVLCVSGIWCGDCVQQGPMLQRIAEASDLIDLRWVDRDEHAELAEHVKINAGLRVPTVIFMAEDFELLGWFGDRTLSRYRAMAAKNLGPACPVPGAPLPDDELAATLQDWIDEFERFQLMLRLSPRLRHRHGD